MKTCIRTLFILAFLSSFTALAEDKVVECEINPERKSPIEDRIDINYFPNEIIALTKGEKAEGYILYEDYALYDENPVIVEYKGSSHCE